MKSSQFLQAAIVTAMLAGGSVHATELVVNGSFEAIPVQPHTTRFFYIALPGWMPFDGPVEVRNDNDGVAADGSNFVELDSDQNSGMYQDISTTAGQRYSLSFQYQDRVFQPSFTQGLEVYWGGQLLTSVASAQPWTTLTFDNLVGAAGSTRLTFHAAGQSDSLGTSLDDVSVTAVPEPHSYAMMVLGLAMVGGVARRKRGASPAGQFGHARTA
ncbi:MAG: PEP-CTERM sorting domain-containing protein [Pseudomonadota bacterium]